MFTVQGGFTLARLVGFMLGNRGGIAPYSTQGMHVCCSGQSSSVCKLHRSG